MKVGDKIPVLIGTIAADGAGTAVVDDRVLHVAGAAPGDQATVRVDAVSRHHARAHGTIVGEPTRGPAFRRAPCHHSAPTRGACGGCPIQHLVPEAALAAKLALAADALSGLASIGGIEPAPAELGYRNRGNFLLRAAPSGAVRFGSKQPRSDAFARMDGCPVLLDPLPAVAAAVAGAVEELGLPLSPEPGGLHGLSVRADRSGRALVELVVVSGGLTDLTAIADRIAARPDVVGVVASEHDGRSSAVRQSRPTLLAGRPELEVTVAGVTTALSSDTFYQLNYAVADGMFRDVVRRAAEIALPEGPVWDLYCGVGVAGIAAGVASGRPVYGADSVAASVSAARTSAAASGVTATFVTADLDSLSDGQLEQWPTPSVVIADPPRRGLSAPVLERLAALRAPVVYASCDPGTFARDARWLYDRGWSITDTRAWDMLPQTTHVELVATLIPTT